MSTRTVAADAAANSAIGYDRRQVSFARELFNWTVYLDYFPFAKYYMDFHFDAGSAALARRENFLRRPSVFGHVPRFEVGHVVVPSTYITLLSMNTQRFRPALYLMISLLLVVGPPIVTVMVLVDPLPVPIDRPSYKPPPDPHPGYSVLGQETGILAGIDNQGQYLNALTNTLTAQTQQLVGLLVGLCVLVAWLFQPQMQRGRPLRSFDAAMLVIFVGCAVGSGYCAYRAHVALLAQVTEAIVYHDGLEAPIAGQAGFLLAANVCAVSLMFMKLVVGEYGGVEAQQEGSTKHENDRGGDRRALSDTNESDPARHPTDGDQQ